MNIEFLERHFGVIGARIKIGRLSRWSRRRNYEIDIHNDRHGEYFNLAVGDQPVDFRLLQAAREQRHLLLLANDGQRFLCGHDERHWFVAGIGDRVSTVLQAKQSLIPKGLREQIHGIAPHELDNRRNLVFLRQGEWFFIPVRRPFDPPFVLRNEPLRRTAQNKPHICEELYRDGGEQVYVVRNEVLSQAEYADRIKDDARFAARARYAQLQVRNPNVYARGAVRHADHATVYLDGWHRVFMNAEFFTRAVAFLD